MTDDVPPGTSSAGEGQNGDQPRPWFPPAGEPGGYAPPPYEPGQAPPAEGYGQPAGGYGAPGGYGPPGGPGPPGGSGAPGVLVNFCADGQSNSTFARRLYKENWSIRLKLVVFT